MTPWKPRKIIFIGSQTPLLKILAKENETEVISSASFLSTIAARFTPDLIVFDSIQDTDIIEVRKIERLVFVPVLIIAESFKELNNLNSISDFSNVIICNETVSCTEEFVERLKSLMTKKQAVLPARTGAIVKYTILYMNKNFQRKITRKNLASQVGMDEDYLTRIFRYEMGVGISGYLSHLRLSEAERFLVFTGMKIQDIAKECGFSNSSYFINSYRKKFGISPGAIRKGR
ncbi:helix-turn-helix transcriptional regulator [Treponema sp.]|uniref:helix-turn-helix transcriptional regulator n=1 Tax=Treponema sp. TaxID=166 RepID=UPI003EFE91E3